MDMAIPADAFTTFGSRSNSQPDIYAHYHHTPSSSTMGYEPSLYAPDATPNYVLNGQASPGMFPDDGDMRLSSSLSTASVPSAPSSAIGSPLSHHGQIGAIPEWSTHGLGAPSIVGNDYMDFTGFGGHAMEELAAFDFATATHPKTFVGEFSLYFLPLQP